MRTPSRQATTMVAVLALVALLAAGCGSSSTTKTTGSAAANAVDQAFVEQMIPHHEMAVQMAQTADTRGQHPQIAALSKNITATQTAEIARLTTIAAQLGVKPDAMPSSSMQNINMASSGHMSVAAHTLGIPAAQMGMSMNMSSLDTAQPFDRAFIDMMIPHHQGAIRMALAELNGGRDPQLKTIATGIIAAQTKEINEMNTWRTSWYGAPSPAGGVPSAA